MLRSSFVLLPLVVVLACAKEDVPAPPADSVESGVGQEAPPDPRVVKAMEELVAYKARLDQNPKDLEALVAMGNANFSLQRFDHAKEWYERALKVDPKRTTTRMDLALALRYLGQPDAAIGELQRVLAAEPKNPAALYNLGVILLEDKNDSPGAIAKWETLMKAHPDHPQVPQLRQMVETIKQPAAAKRAPTPPAGG